MQSQNVFLDSSGPANSYLTTYLPIIIVNIFAMLLLYVYVVTYVTNVERTCCPTPLIKRQLNMLKIKNN